MNPTETAWRSPATVWVVSTPYSKRAHFTEHARDNDIEDHNASAKRHNVKSEIVVTEYRAVAPPVYEAAAFSLRDDGSHDPRKASIALFDVLKQVQAMRRVVLGDVASIGRRDALAELDVTERTLGILLDQAVKAQ